MNYFVFLKSCTIIVRIQSFLILYFRVLRLTADITGYFPYIPIFSLSKRCQKIWEDNNINIASKVSLFGVILVLIFQHYFRISPYLVQMPENTDPNNSKYRHFSRRENFINITRLSICF